MGNDPNIFWGDVLLCAIAAIPVLVFVFRKHINWGTGTGGHDFDSPEPAFNIDGSAMCGHVDTNGNVYGATNNHMHGDR